MSNPNSIVEALLLPSRRGARNVLAALDLLLATGPSYLVRRWREQRRWSALGSKMAPNVFGPIWREAAAEVGAEVDELGDGFFEFRRDGRVGRVWWHWVPLDDIVAMQLALDKPRVDALLHAAGLPVPDHLEFRFTDLDAAAAFLQAAEGDCVVKPASGTSGGDGVTSGIRSLAALTRAVLRASRGDERLLIERQAPGDVYRLMFLDGELLDVVRRHPPRVAGDGRSTVGELIAAENRRRLDARGGLGFTVVTVDLDSVLALRRAGLTLSSVPALGQVVEVKPVVSQNSADDNETVREDVSPELIADAARASSTVGVRLCGVDLITPDISRPLAETGGRIIEVNATPGLQYHYQVADRRNATKVAVPILRAVLKEGGETS